MLFPGCKYFIDTIFQYSQNLDTNRHYYSMTAELLPLHALAAGSALGNSSNWLVNFVENTLWPIIESHLNNYSFIIFIVINFIGFLFCVFCLEETTHKDLDRDHSAKPGVTADLEDSSNSNLDKVEHVENTSETTEAAREEQR